jgi:prophage regulatory protein
MTNSKDNPSNCADANAHTDRCAPAAHNRSPRQGSAPTWAERWLRRRREFNDQFAAKESRNADRLLTKREVRELTGVPYSSMYALIKRGEFPPPRRVGARSSRWLESEIQAWISTRPIASARAART